jgi:uncharacterized membrane protein (DUF373 family)
MERFLKALHGATVVIEVLVAIALIALAAGAVLQLFREMLLLGSSGLALTRQEFNQIIGTVLEVFILIELFRIAVVYMRHENVIPTVLEAALVAIARQFVVFEGGTSYLQTALGLSALLIAVATSWWLLSRSNACDLEEV